ncbi:MAG TPA: endonuclease, partial [Arthrobacter sp.]
MESRTVWSAETRAAFEAVVAATAALAAFTTASADRDADPFRGVDPLRDLADDSLDGLTGAARLE